MHILLACAILELNADDDDCDLMSVVVSVMSEVSINLHCDITESSSGLLA
jgi:hypothetical protein